MLGVIPKVVSKADEAFHVLVSGGFREVEAFELLLVRGYALPC
jgi:hypothetical protein